MGCDVRTAADGPSGLAEILDARPDLAFLDIGLPTMSGWDVASAVRAQLGAAPYLVALTGYGQPQDIERSRVAGFDRHLTKPLDPAKFRELVVQARRRGSRG